MYKIVICDDDRIYAEYLCALIKKCNKCNGIIEVDICESGQECLTRLASQEKCDWLILDLQLGDMNGYEVAEQYRKMYPKGVLFFCSGVFKPTAQSFHTMPYRFIEKGGSEARLIEDIKAAVDYLKAYNDKIYLIGHIRSNKYKICSKDILFIENSKRGSIAHINRKVYTYDNDNDIVLDNKLNTIYELLKDDFEYVNKRCIVNIQYIRSIEKDILTLDDETQLVLSRSVRKKFKDRFAEYLTSF